MRLASRLRLARCAAVGGLLVLTLAATPAMAEPSPADKETARAAMIQGKELASKEDHAGALKEYQTAHAIMRVPTTAMAVARTHVALGHLIEARDAALEVGRMPVKADETEPFAKARERAGELAKELATRIPSVQINIVGLASATPVEVRIDGVPIAQATLGRQRKINPGKHEIIATCAGRGPARISFDIGEKEQKTVPVSFTDSAGPSTPAATLREPAVSPSQAGRGRRIPTITWVAFGVGGAGLIAGSVTGILSLSKASSVKADCTNNLCPASSRDEADTGRSLATASNIGFGVAAAGAAVGIVAWLIAPRPSPSGAPAARLETTRIMPIVGAQSLGVTGWF
jgi:hypothetical protein